MNWRRVRSEEFVTRRLQHQARNQQRNWELVMVLRKLTGHSLRNQVPSATRNHQIFYVVLSSKKWTCKTLSRRKSLNRGPTDLDLELKTRMYPPDVPTKTNFPVGSKRATVIAYLKGGSKVTRLRVIQDLPPTWLTLPFIFVALWLEQFGPTSMRSFSQVNEVHFTSTE
jgi:hypothetical protein